MQNKINTPIRLKLKAAFKKKKKKRREREKRRGNMLIYHKGFKKSPIDVQKQNNLCCKAGAKMQRKKWPPRQLRKAEARLTLGKGY